MGWVHGAATKDGAARFPADDSPAGRRQRRRTRRRAGTRSPTARPVERCRLIIRARAPERIALGDVDDVPHRAPAGRFRGRSPHLPAIVQLEQLAEVIDRLILRVRPSRGDLDWRRHLPPAPRRKRDDEHDTSSRHREYFRPAGVDHMLDLAWEAGDGWQRSILFCRERADRDFTERDRAVLELLRPHLRRRVLARTTDRPVELDGGGPGLTVREREVVFLAGSGMSNAAIGAELWISAATVKKHLENAYQKLGVGSRAAAAGRIGSRRDAG